jgi:hypothetical protein
MRKNGYINDRLKMNVLPKHNNKTIEVKKTIKKSIKRNNSSNRYLDMYQKEKALKTNKNKNLLTPDVKKKKNKKYEKLFLDDNLIALLYQDKETINNNINLLSNSFDFSKSFDNIEEYMNFYFNSPVKNPSLNKTNEIINENINKNNIRKKIISKYSYKNKKWILIEEFNNKESNRIYWKEYSDNILIEKNDDINDFNILEKKYNYLKLEHNKIKQLFTDLNTKYENLNKKNKESQNQLNYYLLKIKEFEKDKEKYLKKNKKLKEEITKIPFLIKEEMNKFREEAGRKISKKIYELEQENKILKGERYNLNERKIIDKYEQFNGNRENIINYTK